MHWLLMMPDAAMLLLLQAIISTHTVLMTAHARRRAVRASVIYVPIRLLVMLISKVIWYEVMLGSIIYPDFI